MKLTYEEAAVISYLADRAENLGSEIKHLEGKLNWLKKAHAQVVEDAKAARELLHNAEMEDSNGS